MRRFNGASTVLAIAAVAGWLLAAPISAASRQGGGRATSSRPPSGGGGGGGGGGSAAPRGGGSSGGGLNGGGQTAVPRDNGAGSGSTSGSGSSGATSSRPTSSRGSTSGTVAGRATQPANGSGGGTRVVIPNGYYGGFYPWGYAGLGFGGYYAGYYGSYDPWLYDPYYDAPIYAPDGRADSELRLKVKPRDAKVYVDGYFAGVVDDFDGVFQRLHLVPGPHHIEVRADGYEPLAFDVDARRNRTTTFEQDMKSGTGN